MVLLTTCQASKEGFRVYLRKSILFVNPAILVKFLRVKHLKKGISIKQVLSRVFGEDHTASPVE